MSERARETVSLRGERVAYLDLLRVVSICFVVMIHTVYQSFNSLPVEGWEWQTLNVYDSLSRWAVPIFVMISGALFLDRQKPLREILKKNVLRLVTAYLFWLAVYSVINQIYYHDFDSTLTHIIKGHYHMWFILMIIGLYLVTPLLRKIVEDDIPISGGCRESHARIARKARQIRLRAGGRKDRVPPPQGKTTGAKDIRR